MSDYSMKQALNAYRRALGLQKEYTLNETHWSRAEVEKDRARPQKAKMGDDVARALGADKWSHNAVARDNQASQHDAERQIQMFGMMTLLDLMTELVAELRTLNRPSDVYVRYPEVELPDSSDSRPWSGARFSDEPT